MRLRGLTAIELLLVVAMIAVTAAAASLPLATLQPAAGLTGGVDDVISSLRRAQLQATSGYGGGVAWGVHFSETDACALPSKSFSIYAGSSFSSASSTTVAVSLPNGAKITGLSIAGGGCNTSFARFSGLASGLTSSGTDTVTITDNTGNSKTVLISYYGRVSRQ